MYVVQQERGEQIMADAEQSLKWPGAVKTKGPSSVLIHLFWVT